MKAKRIPKALVNAALIRRATFYPIAFYITLIFLAIFAANFPTSIESYHPTYCYNSV